MLVYLSLLCVALPEFLKSVPALFLCRIMCAVIFVAGYHSSKSTSLLLSYTPGLVSLRTIRGASRWRWCLLYRVHVAPAFLHVGLLVSVVGHSKSPGQGVPERFLEAPRHDVAVTQSRRRRPTGRLLSPLRVSTHFVRLAAVCASPSVEKLTPAFPSTNLSPYSLVFTTPYTYGYHQQ